MQTGERYGILPDLQPFVASRASPQLFGQLQNIPCVSQTRPNISPLGEHLPRALHLPLQHSREHFPQRPHQHQFQGEIQNLQQQPLNQALNIQHQHFLEAQTSHSPIVQQLPPHSHSPEIPTSIATASPIQLKQFVATSLGHDGFQDAVDRGTGFNRWSREETPTLLKLRSEMDASFRDSSFRGPLWEEVSRFNETACAKDSQLEHGDGSVHIDEKLHEMGYHRSAIKCNENFENVQKYYKRTDGSNSGMQDGNNYRFLSELEAVRAENNNDDDHNVGEDSGGSSCGGIGGTSTGKGHGLDAVERVRGSAATAGDVSIRKPDTTSSALNLSSDSSEEEHVRSDDVDEQDSAKRRKRKSRSSPSRAFLETFTRQILRQQETLHKKFVDTIEKRELERTTREEAYRRQETARLNREQQLRAQELALTATRDAALLAFLSKASGQSFELPKMNSQTTLSNAGHSDVQVEANQKLAGGAEINTKRWPKMEVYALIRLRSGMDPRFQEAGPKAHLWQEISTSMACIGFSRSPKRCKEKWENINKYFKKTKGICRKRPENAKTCPYFHQLDTLYRRGILASSSGKFNRIGNLSENMLENIIENADIAQNENAETLAIVPIGQRSPDSAQATSSTALKSHSDAENNPEADVATLEPSQSAVLRDTYTNQSAATGSQIHRLQAVDGASVTKRSIQMEMFVKDILQMQQQQHQKLVDEYEKMEQAREVRDTEKQQIKQSVPASAQGQGQSHTKTVHDNNAALMALVQKLAGDSSDLTMSAPSSME